MDEALIKRVLPHSVEAEQSVIGSMLMDREAIIAASEIITGADFYQHQYGVMFESMVELFNEGKPVDLVTLQNRLREKDVPPEVSSLDFVREILTTVPTSANVKHYAQIVQEKAVLRRLIRVNEEIANSCYAGKDSLEHILAHTEKSIFDLLQSRNSGEFVPIRQVALNVLEKIEQAAKTNDTVTGIPTGFIDLDYRTSGFQPSDFILIAARPSMGKTAFVLNVVEHVAVKKQYPCMVFSLEMSKEQLVNRMLSMESNVDSQKLRTGTLTDSDWDAVVEGVGDHGCEYMTGGRVVVLGKTGKNFAAGMSGGIAYVLDEDSDLYMRTNKEMVSMQEITSKYDVLELKEMIKEHVALTNSDKGKRILDHFSEYLPKFKKVIPYDYNRMQMAIVQMEEKGLNAEQAQIEAFYASTRA